jgi:hypothetical protein
VQRTVRGSYFEQASESSFAMVKKKRNGGRESEKGSTLSMSAEDAQRRRVFKNSHRKDTTRQRFETVVSRRMQFQAAKALEVSRTLIGNEY